MRIYALCFELILSDPNSMRESVLCGLGETRAHLLNILPCCGMVKELFFQKALHTCVLV